MYFFHSFNPEKVHREALIRNLPSSLQLQNINCFCFHKSFITQPKSWYQTSYTHSSKETRIQLVTSAYKTPAQNFSV